MVSIKAAPKEKSDEFSDVDSDASTDYFVLTGILLATQMIVTSIEKGLREILKKFPIVGKPFLEYLTSLVQHGACVIQIVVAIALGRKIINGVHIN